MVVIPSAAQAVCPPQSGRGGVREPARRPRHLVGWTVRHAHRV